MLVAVPLPALARYRTQPGTNADIYTANLNNRHSRHTKISYHHARYGLIWANKL